MRSRGHSQRGHHPDPPRSRQDADSRPAGSRHQLARARRRAWAFARSGIHAPRDPAIVPADLANALRLRAARAAEAAIDDLIERHLRVAGYAVTQFTELREHAADDWAHDTAIRRAGITFHLSGPAPHDPPGRGSPAPGPAAQDSTALVRPPRGRRDLGPVPRGPGSGGRPPAGSAQVAASGFPAPVSDVVAAADPSAAQPAGPGARHVPARRPGLSR